MASLKELRNRISSVEATRKITRAMQMVAASKLRRAQEAAEAARPYAARMEQLLQNLSAGAATDNAPPLLGGTGSDKVHLLIVVTSERGLCGGFNAQIARRAREDAQNLLAAGKQVKILCIGRKGYDVLRRYVGELLLPPISYQGQKSVGFMQAQAVATQILKDFSLDDKEDDKAQNFDIATLYYANFITVLSQEVVARQLIPCNIPEQIPTASDETESKQSLVYDYEPDEETLLASLLPRYVAVQILRALLENAAGEQGARMSAMDSATRNAGEMIDALTITYNRTRQAQITKELIEIISGAEAL